MSLVDAAIACGIPQPEAETWLAEKRSNLGDAAVEMREVATAALTTAMKKLQDVVEDGPRESVTHYDEKTGKPTRSVTPQNVDVEAAKALAVLAVNALKLSAGAGGSRSGEKDNQKSSPDLWDAPGNWDLTKPE
jgi:hypothetical protein